MTVILLINIWQQQQVVFYGLFWNSSLKLIILIMNQAEGKGWSHCLLFIAVDVTVFEIFFIAFRRALVASDMLSNYFQKQPSKDILKKSCSENMQQINRKTPVLKYDCNKIAVALQLYWYHTSARVFSCIFAAYFQNIFPYKNTSAAPVLLKLFFFICSSQR